MKKFFTLGIAASLLLITVARMKAQDAQNPWHLIAFENEKEVAFYNTEVITGIEATEQNVTIVLENGKEFSHPLATTTFGFDPRREGTATTNESFTTPQWNVYYSNSRLHFSEAVNSVAVFTITGALVAQFAGSYSEVSVNLSSGIYFVQAGGKSTKLLVNDGSGSAVERQETVMKTVIDAQPAPIGLRSDNSIKEYWNIIANNSAISVKISDVEKFSFKSDTLVFTLKNGGTVELSNYQGVEFTIEPSEPTTETHWDLERTFANGGGAYGYDSNLDYPISAKVEFISVVSKTDIILYDVQNGKETKYSRNLISIGTEEWPMNREDACYSFYKDGSTNFLALTITQYNSFTDQYGYKWNNIVFIPLIPALSTTYYIPYYEAAYDGSRKELNCGTSKIPTTFTIDKDGNLVAAYVNADGVSRQYTFRK